jgi:hypothetical protein
MTAAISDINARFASLIVQLPDFSKFPAGFKARWQAAQDRISAYLSKNAGEKIAAETAEWRQRNPEEALRYDEDLRQEAIAARRASYQKRLADAFAEAKAYVTPANGCRFPDDSFANDPRYGNVYPPIGKPNVNEFDERENDYRDVCLVSARKRRKTMGVQTVSLAKALECRGETFFYGETLPDHVLSHTSASLLPVMREQLSELYLFRQSRHEADLWAELFMDDAILQACDLDYEAHEFIHVRLGGEVTRHVLKL